MTILGPLHILTTRRKHPARSRCHERFWLNGRWGGIRTHGTLSRTPVFKTGSLNHSDTHPSVVRLYSGLKMAVNPAISSRDRPTLSLC